MKKKIFICLFTFVLISFSFVACFGGDDEDMLSQTPSMLESEMEEEDDDIITSDDSEDLPQEESSSKSESE